MLTNQTFAFIGAGAMAEAIIGGLIRKELVQPDQISVTNHSDTDKLLRLEKEYGIRSFQLKKTEAIDASVIILAMKPKHAEDAIHSIRHKVSNEQIIVSVMAGISTMYMENLFAIHPPVIRAMPNTSAKVGASATAICLGSYASSTDGRIAEALFRSIGTVTELTEEKMDAVTGIAGSGPAYLYYMAEAMEHAGRQAGLREDEAKELIIQTFFGAALRLQHTEKTSKELYKEIMSPAGTTEAAFDVLEQHHVQEYFTAAIMRAIERSKELGNTTATPFK